MDKIDSRLTASGQPAPSSDSSLRSSLQKKALELLARREHSKAELSLKLQRKFPADSDSPLIPELLDDLCEQGLLSDERFTEAYIHMRARKGYGPNRIALELAEKGVDGELVAQTLGERQDWSEVLEQVWRKKFNTVPSSYADKAKQMRFLHYRGFSAGDIQRLLDSC